MQKTGIEYLDFTYNFVKGKCPNTDCPIWSECYMKRPPSCWAVEKNPRLHCDTKILFQKFPDEPCRIGVGFNLELFHKKIPSAYIEAGLKEIREHGQKHTWLFLTKCPARYAEFDFPKNCWLGVTVTRPNELPPCATIFGDNKVKNLLFVSYEPLFERCPISIWSKWNIMGALTGPKAKQYKPEREEIREMVEVSRLSYASVFLKDNLAPIWGGKLIREFPQEQ